jgi:hypothetical protein
MKEDRLVPGLRGKEPATAGRFVGLAEYQASGGTRVDACASHFIKFILQRKDLPLQAQYYYHIIERMSGYTSVGLLRGKCPTQSLAGLVFDALPFYRAYARHYKRLASLAYLHQWVVSIVAIIRYPMCQGKIFPTEVIDRHLV